MVQAVRMKNYIIAGTYQEYSDWLRRKILSPSVHVCVSTPAVLRGTQNPHGWFIGTWRKRDDLEYIFMELLTRTDITSDSHRRINNIWGKWKERL
jgi:hypothetical protein